MDINNKLYKAYARGVNFATEKLEKQNYKKLSEAVKEILRQLLNFIGANQKFCIVDDEHKTLIDVNNLFDFIIKLANEYGIELE